MDIKIKIGQRIKDLRTEIQMSQKELAYASDLDRSYIASIENGKRNVSIVNIEKISIALGSSLNDFFKSRIFENINGD